jgi:ribosomal protein S18 acetylase RimI-like enzyme
MPIRRALVGDAERIAEVHVAAWRAAYRNLLDEPLLEGFHVPARTIIWREVLSQSEPNSLVAVATGEVVGFVHFVGMDSGGDGGRMGEVTSIYVEPSHWRRGYGGELLSRALAELGEKGCLEAVMWVFEANGPARRFYETHGFALDGGRKLHAPSGLPEFRYRRGLGGTMTTSNDQP